jgi:hypothetical protein
MHFHASPSSPYSPNNPPLRRSIEIGIEFPFRMLIQFRRFYKGTSVLVSLLGLQTEITYEKTDSVARILLGFTSSVPAVVPLAAVVVALDASFIGASLQ